jgi:hypothetical protein
MDVANPDQEFHLMPQSITPKMWRRSEKIGFKKNRFNHLSRCNNILEVSINFHLWQLCFFFPFLVQQGWGGPQEVNRYITETWLMLLRRAGDYGPLFFFPLRIKLINMNPLREKSVRTLRMTSLHVQPPVFICLSTRSLKDIIEQCRD